MAFPMAELTCIDDAAHALLASVGIATTADLLARCGTPDDRGRVAEQTGLSERALRQWTGMSDLLRIEGLTPRFAELLAAVGAGTLPALRKGEPDRLADAMLAVQAERRSTRLVPSASVLGDWIEQAGLIEPALIENTGGH